MVVFIVALESEAEPVLSRMEILKSYTQCERKVVCGEMFGRKTAVIVCGVGKVNAAAATQYAIDVLGANKIINVGFAGGLNKTVAVGSVYGIEKAVQYDFDLVQLNKTQIGTLNEYSSPYIEVATLPLYPVKTLGTGDRFNDDKADFLLLTKELNADIRDMEGGAVAHVCKRANVKCYIFKAISDIAGAGSTTAQFLSNVKLCAKAVGDNVEKIFLGVDGAA